MLKTEKPALTAAIAAVIPVVAKTAKVPIIRNLCIERDGEELVLRGTSMDIEIAVRLDVSFEGDFIPFTLPAHLLEDAVRRMPDGAEIRIERVDDPRGALQSVNIRTGRSRVKLPVLPASDFPKLDAGNLSHQISLNAGALAKRIKAVLPAVETDQSRYYLAGVLLQPAEDGLRTVATDGRRLAVRFIPAIEIDQSETLSTVPQVIVPTRVVERALKVMEGEQDVTLDLSDQKIRVSAGRTVMIGKLVEGSYPDYSRVRPSQHAARLAFSSSALQSAIGRVLVVTPDASLGVGFHVADGKMVLNARDNAVGDADDEIACEAETEFRGGFHGMQMRDALESADADNLEYLVGPAPDDATLLRVPGDSENYTILMPMQPKYARPEP